MLIYSVTSKAESKGSAFAFLVHEKRPSHGSGLSRKNAVLAFLVYIFSFSAYADWAGLFEGQGRTQKSAFNNCDVTFDLFLDAKKEFFMAPQLAFWCSQPDGSSINRTHSTVKLRVHPNGDLRTDLGTLVGTYSDQYLFLKTFGLTPSNYEFFKDENGVRTVKITDLTTSEVVEATLE